MMWERGEDAEPVEFLDDRNILEKVQVAHRNSPTTEGKAHP
jgi:hypothetical protein